MKRATLVTSALATVSVLAVASPALAMRDPGPGGMSLYRYTPPPPRAGTAPMYNHGLAVPVPLQRGEASLGDQYRDGMGLYQYLRANPIVRRDPHGLYGEDMHEGYAEDLARIAGFTPANAHLLALADERQDTAGPQRDALALRTHLGGPRDWTLGQCFWSNCLFWDNAAADLWHLPREQRARGRVHPSSPQSTVLMRAGINNGAQLILPHYISFRLECGHVDTDIESKSGAGRAYHLEIEQTAFGGRSITITAVQDPLDTFGQGLHAFQDSFAHQGGLTGHGWRGMPNPDRAGDQHVSWPLNRSADDPWQDRSAFRGAVAGTLGWMAVFLNTHNAYGTFNNMTNAVNAIQGLNDVDTGTLLNDLETTIGGSPARIPVWNARGVI